MKDGPISKLRNIKTGHRPSQFKEIFDALSVFCADKNCRGLNEVLCARSDKVEDDLIPAYPDANQWSTTHHVQIASVNQKAIEEVDATMNKCPVSYKIVDCHGRKSVKEDTIRI